MNQKLFSGITAALMVSTFGLAPSGSANQTKASDEQSRVQVPEVSVTSQVSALEPSATTPFALPQVSSQAPTRLAAPQPLDSDSELKSSSVISNVSGSDSGIVSETLLPAESATQVATTSTPAAQTSAPNAAQPTAAVTEAVKVGEYQSQEEFRSEVTVATIQSHPLRGRQAATLYVRNIPVLSFLGRAIGTESTSNSSPASTEVKIASVQSGSGTAVSQAGEADPAALESEGKLATAPMPSEPAIDSRDPVWRATTTAARLNQLHRDGVAASEIKVIWDAERQGYVIQANGSEILVLDADTVLPDTVSSSAGDLLQATNRLRRQMGNAAPLSTIEGDPNGYGQISLGPISLRASGYASWYGPGFDGNYSASGEIFNQNAMTAAHPSLPFGTEVRVTNLDNGQSVVVRINDRGPYSHGRVIDLSAGAARIIGLISSGVAPVSLEVLGTTARSIEP